MSLNETTNIPSDSTTGTIQQIVSCNVYDLTIYYDGFHVL